MQDTNTLFQQLLSEMPDIAKAIIGAILVFNLIAWFFLPFAVYGIKARLNENRKVNEQILKALSSR